MKRLLIAVSATMLALPGVAAANPNGQRHGHAYGHAKHTGKTTTQNQQGQGEQQSSTGDTTASAASQPKNAAFACRAERDTSGDDAFAAKYGANGNKRNAFGKCVAQTQRDDTKAHLSQTGSGTATRTGSTIAATVTLTGKPVANATATVSLTLGTLMTHGKSTRSCGTATGDATIADTTVPANSLTETISGRVCQTSAGEIAFVGRYTITGGTGTLATSTGTGRIELMVNADGTVSLAEQGGYSAA